MKTEFLKEPIVTTILAYVAVASEIYNVYLLSPQFLLGKGWLDSESLDLLPVSFWGQISGFQLCLLYEAESPF